MITVGSGKYIYDVAVGWGKLPKPYSFTKIPSIGVDSRDRIFVFNRYPNLIFVLDREGNFLNAWGKDVFLDCVLHRAHGLYVARDDTIYLTDVGDHTVRSFTLDGELLLTLGTEGKPGKEGEPFRKPTGAAVSNSGDIFVADGYENARIHKFTSEGGLVKSWGKPGTGPGEFNLPHGIWVDKDDHVWVADRENSRIQVFTTEGEYISQLTDLIRPMSIFIDSEDTVYVAEAAGRMSILTTEGKLLARWGGEKKPVLDFISNHPGNFISYRDLVKDCLKTPGSIVAAHGCCVDSRGDLYVGESLGERITKFVRE